MSIPGVQPQPHHRYSGLVPSTHVCPVLLNLNPTLGPDPNLSPSPSRTLMFTLGHILPHRTPHKLLIVLMILM